LTQRPRPLFTFITSPGSSEVTLRAIGDLRDRFGLLFDTKIHFTDDLEQGRAGPNFQQNLGTADIVFIEIMGGGRPAAAVRQILEGSEQTVVLLVDSSPELMSVLRMGQLRGRAHQDSPDLPFWLKAKEYWGYGGEENIANMVSLIGRRYAQLGVPEPSPPQPTDPFGLVDLETGRRFNSLAAYRDVVGFEPQKPTVALLMYGGRFYHQSAAPARAVGEALRARIGANLIPLFAETGHTLEAFETLLLQDGQPVLDAAVSFRWFQLTSFSAEDPNEGLRLLQKLDVPIFNGCPLYSREMKEWEESTDGCSPVETLTAVILPELDGLIEPLPTCALQEATSDLLGGDTFKKVVPLTERIAQMVGRIANWCRLRTLPNKDKRVALMVYNIPPGEDNIGNAAYLDVFESLRQLLMAMRDQGYSVENIPEPGEFPKLLIDRGLVNLARWSEIAKALKNGPSVPVEEYEPWLAGSAEKGDIETLWGEAPGRIMTHKGRMSLPSLQFGNVLVGIQPVRGWHDEPEKLTHDKSLPPHHQYIGFYHWLEEGWKADAIVHVGTHGTLEFLKGKEMAMGPNCWPARLIGSLPHLYIYHVVNASEAIIAKRRSLGTTVNYNSPFFDTAGLYDAYTELEDLVVEHSEAASLNPGRAQKLLLRIEQKARELELPEALDALHEELALLKRSTITQGLHILGERPDADERARFATFLLRTDRDDGPSLHRMVAEARGWAYLDLTRNPFRDGKDRLAEIEQDVLRWCGERLEGNTPELSEEMLAALECATSASLRLDGDGEITNLLAGLDGRFVTPGIGGDPLRDPGVLPTGRNSFQFDPRLVPSAEACRRGREIAENTLRHYHELHGQYPSTTAVILWGFETTKTRGETVGQILAYLGVELVTGNPYFRPLRVIPRPELGRPRVDCLVQICGFFRDMYPNVMTLIDRAVEMAADKDEDDNAVAAHTRQLEQELAGQVDPALMGRIARGRIYGPRSGEYGTRTTHLIETGAWSDEEEISSLYRQSMSHLYTEGVHGVRYESAYHKTLEKVELVSQVRDSHEYEIADLDHYYEYFGGLARSIASVRGRLPEMLISDTTRETIRTETVDKALERGVRTRLLNPKWIDPLLEHDYHGAQEISDRVEYLVGFAATTQAVKNWVWSGVHQRYIEDEAMFERLRENNRFATEAIMERLFEAERRGYWRPTDHERETLTRRYLELEEALEGEGE
jgi:cobaltochelatase CobN